MHVRHIATVFPAANAAHRHRLRRRLIHAGHEHHPAHEVDEQVAGDAGAVFFPTAPTREDEGIERDLRRDCTLPGVPVEIRGREVWRWRVLPRSGWIIAAEPALDEHHVAEHAARDHLLGFGANLRADALRADLHDTSTFLGGIDHGDAVGGGVGDRLLAV